MHPDRCVDRMNLVCIGLSRKFNFWSANGVTMGFSLFKHLLDLGYLWRQVGLRRASESV